MWCTNNNMTFFDNFFNRIDLSSINIPNIGLNSVIDILVVAFISYMIILWIKQTRAWSLFKGIVVILIISAVSYLFDLYTVWWIISSTLSLGIIAVIIIFQPEMRRALEQIGKSKFIFVSQESQPKDIADSSVREIIKAAKKLSDARTGALIVIEKDVPLGDLESSGVSIDAFISSQLLINIFENKTPLHDGAVIIRNNRIASAACILPLTQSDVSDDMGTRHRAAIGASEVSDAVVLVVSEETGIISVTRGGNIYRNLDENTIRGILSGNLRQSILRRNLWGGRK